MSKTPRPGGGRLLYVNCIHSYSKINQWRLVKDKALTKVALERFGISVPKGKHFKRSDYGSALNFASKILPNVVVKPSDSSRGLGITIGVQNPVEFERAWIEASRHTTGHILVEELFRGQCEARFLVVGDRCISVTGRIPPHLIGDGKSTVRDLVAQKNMMRRSNPNLESKLLELDDSRLAALARSGIEEQAVLPEGELLIIDWKAGLSSGADSIQLLDYVHPTYLDLALKACDAVTGLTVCGVDIMATDFSLPAEPGNHAVVELNSAPGLGGHYFPVYGPVKDVARNIVELHVRMLRNEKDISAGEFFAQSLKDEFDNEENVLLQSLETAFEKRDIEDEVSENPTRLVEISLFGNLYHSGILDHIQKYCNDKSINGWVRNRIDYVSPGSVRLRVMGPVESIEGLIRDLREGEFSQKITNIVVVKAKRATRRGFRILNDQRIAVKDAGFEITPGNIGASAPTNSEATRRILIKGEWQVSRARTWCTGLALSLGLTIKCKSKGEDTLICRLQGAEEKIDEFLRHAVVGPEDMRIEMIRVLPLPQDAAQSSAPPQLRKTSQTGPRVLQFAKRMVRRVTAR